MYPVIAHIYGSFNINSYGVMICLGILVFTWFCQNNTRIRDFADSSTITNIITLGIFSGVIGGRLLYFATNFFHHGLEINTLAYIWQGGFSVLGSIGAILITLSIYLHYKKLPILQLLDVAGIYGGLLQGIARIGCFLSGCCYGTPTQLPWAVFYTNPECKAPLYIWLHPVQLYSTINYFLIFLLFYYGAQKWCTKPGQLIFGYVTCAALERFLIDYLRGDAHQTCGLPFSVDQLVSIVLIILGAALFIFVSKPNNATRAAHESV